MNTAVLLVIFRRADTLRQVVNRLRAVKPSRVYVAADGPRSEVPGEAERCDSCKAVIDEIDWPCLIQRRFSPVNQGCRWGPINAITWFFEHETAGIILEDDILPDPTFFPFIEELLERYRHRSEVGCICGYNFLAKEVPTSYYFSNLALTWGWATWRDRWQSFSEVCDNLEHYLGAVKLNGWLSRHDERDFKRKLRQAYAGDHVWDFLWMFTLWAKHCLTILPSRSLTRNIGVGGDATHTHVETPFIMAPSEPMQFPLQHPSRVSYSINVDQAIFRDLLHTPTWTERVIVVLKSGRPLGRLREIVLRRIRARWRDLQIRTGS
jgi:hypothetical protein